MGHHHLSSNNNWSTVLSLDVGSVSIEDAGEESSSSDTISSPHLHHHVSHASSLGMQAAAVSAGGNRGLHSTSYYSRGDSNNLQNYPGLDSLTLSPLSLKGPSSSSGGKPSIKSRIKSGVKSATAWIPKVFGNKTFLTSHSNANLQATGNNNNRTLASNSGVKQQGNCQLENSQRSVSQPKAVQLNRQGSSASSCYYSSLKGSEGYGSSLSTLNSSTPSQSDAVLCHQTDTHDVMSPHHTVNGSSHLPPPPPPAQYGIRQQTLSHASSTPSVVNTTSAVTSLGNTNDDLCGLADNILEFLTTEQQQQLNGLIDGALASGPTSTPQASSSLNNVSSVSQHQLHVAPNVSVVPPPSFVDMTASPCIPSQTTPQQQYVCPPPSQSSTYNMPNNTMQTYSRIQSQEMQPPPAPVSQQLRNQSSSYGSYNMNPSRGSLTHHQQPPQ